MNKFCVLIACGIVMMVTLSQLAVADKPEKTGELVNELSDEEEFGPDGGLKELWGSNDVLEDGVGKYKDPVTAECIKKKSSSECRVCCRDKGKAFSYEPTTKQLHKFSLHRCTCFNITPTESH